MVHTIFVIIYILTILAVIFLERKSPTEALLWVLVVGCLPYVGVILYLIFGSTIAIKLTAYGRKKRLRQCHPDMTPPSVGNLEEFPLSEEDQQVMNFNTAYNESEVTCYDKADIYTVGVDHYTQLFRDIKNAKECIYIEFYTIQHDVVGERFVEALTHHIVLDGVKFDVDTLFGMLNVPEQLSIVIHPCRINVGLFIAGDFTLVVRGIKPHDLPVLLGQRKFPQISHTGWGHVRVMCPQALFPAIGGEFDGNGTAEHQIQDDAHIGQAAHYQNPEHRLCGAFPLQEDHRQDGQNINHYKNRMNH